MKKEIAILFSTGLLCLGVFFAIFCALQNKTIFEKTLENIAHTYERIETKESYKILKTPNPYVEVSAEKFLRWDAEIFGFIKDRRYINEEKYKGEIRAAFFPLFPAVWRVSGFSARSISIFNYLIFILSVAILMAQFYKGSLKEKVPIYTILITLPTSVIYHIPYSESLFMLFMTVVAIGIVRQKYWLYFVGAMLLAMVRPATIFVLLAILAVEGVRFLQSRGEKGRVLELIKRSIIKARPFVLGYFVTILIQYESSGSWSSFYEAHLLWARLLPSASGITDWSVEGFGMNVFSIFFVSSPAMISSVVILKKTSIKELSKRQYLLLISLLYLSGILIFTILTSHGNLHSFFRFVMASPLFYLSVILALDQITSLSSKFRLRLFTAMFLSLSSFFAVVGYGGGILKFEYTGLFLLLGITGLALSHKKHLPPKTSRRIAFSGLVFFSIVWNTYMLNAFLCNAWTFT